MEIGEEESKQTKARKTKVKNEIIASVLKCTRTTVLANHLLIIIS